MILRRLSVEGFKCFAEPVSIELDEQGVHILAAPNGSGKSTMAEALRMAFLTSHRSASEEVKAVAPWGRALAPRVAAEFVAGGKRWRLEKQWLQSAAAALLQWNNGAWSRIAEGPAAEESLRRFAGMPEGYDPGAKDRSKYWTSVLWTPQGGLAVGNAEESVVERVRASLQQQSASAVAERIAEAAKKCAAVYWTATWRVAKYSPAAALRADCDAARARAVEARARIDELERLREQLAGAQTRQTELAEQVHSLTKEWQTATALAQQAARIRDEHHREHSARELLNEQARARQEELKRWRATEQRVQESRVRIAALLACAGEDPASEAAALAKEVAAAEAALRDALAYTVASAERAQLRQQWANAVRAAAAVQETQDALEALRAPSSAQWETLREMGSAMATARDRLEGALVHLDIEAARAMTVDVVTGTPAGVHDLAEGARLRVSGSPLVDVHVEGVARWRASGPAASAQELQRRIAELEQQWTAQTAAFGTGEFEALRERREQAAALEKELMEQRAQHRALLGGGTAEALQARLQAMEAACAAHETRHAGWAAAPPDPAAIEQHLQGLRARSQQALARVQARREAALLEEQLAADEAQVARFSEAHESAAALEARLDAMALQLRGHELRLEELAQALAPFAPDLDATAARLAGALDAARQQSSAVRDEAQRLRGRIEEQAAQAPCRTLAEAEEAVFELERTLAEAEQDAAAARLLHETLTACRAEMLSSVAGTVADDATRILEEIAGAGLGAVSLSAALAPQSVAPAAAGGAVVLNQLSGGESEQVHFAARLALAEYLCAEEPQLAVFDDVWMATDPARLARILALLEERRERMQILILTCDEERYRALPQARRLSLPARG